MDRSEALEPYWMPDPGLVETLSKSGTKLSYVSHVNTQATLDQIDPDWKLELVCDHMGVPDIRSRPYELTNREGTVYAHGVTLTLWGTMTLLGSTRWGVGTVDANKPDAEKELVGDLIRNCAMRHGVFAGLWAKDKPVATEPKAGSYRSNTAREAPPPDQARAAIDRHFSSTEEPAIEWSDHPDDQSRWTEHHLARIAGLLNSSPAKMHDRIITGLRERQHVEAESWVEVPPDMWVDSVLKFEGWAEKKAAERA